ncbi:hypothetical protein FXO38_25945 [Capsicum annuum]|nr:hypothetical protein FXO38_25945 [Capsicum annuum]KAF3670617.1 hypothetical protein FXO37_08447 [Capsicum annuum]
MIDGRMITLYEMTEDPSVTTVDTESLKRMLQYGTCEVMDELSMGKTEVVQKGKATVYPVIAAKVFQEPKDLPLPREVVIITVKARESCRGRSRVKAESPVEEEAFISKKVFDAFRDEQQYEDKDFDLQHMDYVGAETSPQRFSPNVDKNLCENLNDEILLSLNAYRRKSIITHPSTIHAEETTDENLNDKKSESVVKDDCQQIDVFFYYLRKKSKSVMDVYSVDDPNLNARGQEAYLNEYINGFRIHAAVPWHTVEDIYILVNIKKKYHWVVVVLSFSKRCIFLCDSYESSGNYAVVLAEIKKLAEIIPLCLQACNFYEKKECLSYGQRVSPIEFNPNVLRTRYAALLWDYGMRKQEANAHSDFEAPLRLVRQSRITSVIEVFDVWWLMVLLNWIADKLVYEYRFDL